MAMFTNVTQVETVSKIKIGFIDHDNTEFSTDFRSYLTDKLNMQLNENESFDTLATMLINKKISVIIEVPANFEKDAVSGSAADLITTSLDDYENVSFVNAYLNTYMNSRILLADSAGGDMDVFHALLDESQNNTIAIENVAASDIVVPSSIGSNAFVMDSTYSQAFVPCMGFYLMIGFIFYISFAFMIFDDRTNGTYQRMQATPVTSVQYIVGTTLFGVFNGLLIIGVFFAYILLSKTDIGVSYGNTILLMVLIMLLQIGFSMMVGQLLKSKSAVLTSIFAYGTVGSMIGGAWFPIDFGPDSIQKIAKTTPNYWFMDAFRRMQENSDANIVSNVIVLVLFIILVYLISAIRFARNSSV
jgi:ABC-2 type transport system permease protein